MKGIFGLLGIILVIILSSIFFNIEFILKFSIDFPLLMIYIPALIAYIYAAILVNNTSNRFFIIWIVASIVPQIIAISYLEGGSSFFMGLAEALYWGGYFPIISIIVQVSCIIIIKVHKLNKS